MADITRRSAGEAGWVYDVGGKTYFTEREAQRVAAAIDNAQAQQQTTQDDSQQQTSNAWSVPDPVSPPSDWKGNGTVIERNSDGTATINLAGGGQHTVSSGNAVKTLQEAYGVTKVVDSGISSTEQKQLRDNTWNAYSEYVAAKNVAENLNARDKILNDANVNFTQEQVQEIINRNGFAGYAASHPANKSAISNAILGMSMGLSFDEATDMSSDGGFYTMLRQGYSTDEWKKPTSQLTADDLQTIGGKLKYFQSTLTALTYGVVGSKMDTRDWGSAVTSGNAIKGLQVATNQMHGGVRVAYMSGYEKDENGEDILDKPLPSTPYLVGGNGSILTTPGNSTRSIYDNMRNFGVRDLSWAPQFIDSLGDYSSNNRLKSIANGINTLSSNWDSYWKGSEYLWDMNLASMYEIPKKEVTTTPTTTTPTTTPQIQEPTPPAGTPPVGDQTYPEYTPPESIIGTGTGTGATTPGYGQPTEESVQAGLQMYGTLPFQYTPTQTYQIGQGGTTGQQQAGQQQTYTVRQFRNATGLTTSITFVNGKPTTTIPAGFYPVENQPAMGTVQAPTVAAPAVSSVQAAGTPMAPQAPAAPSAPQAPVPASSQIVPFEQQTQQAQQFMGTASGYMPQYMQPPVSYQMAQGGSVPMQSAIKNTQPVGEFAGFRPEALQRIANTVGYQGDMNGFNAYLQQNPAANEQMTYFMNAARKMAKGGVLKAQEGVDTTGAVQSGNATKVMPTALNQQYIPQQNFPAGATLPQVQAEIAKTPGLPTGATVVPVGTTLEAGQLVSPYSGQVSGAVALPTAQAATTAAAMPQQMTAAQASTIESTPAVNSALQTLQAAQMSIDPRAEVLAAQQTASSIGNVQAAQGNAILMDNPIQRQIQNGELISGAANAETAAAFTEQLQAAQATPSEQATVQGQLEGLMAQFEGGNTPAWAAGSMRKAMGTLAARGLGASSLAGQAVIQAAMEAALPIAQMDAATQSQFEQLNLSNRQQRVMLAAQQRASFLGMEFDQEFQSRVANAAKISDIANTNFTTEVQIALENSRIANSMNLQNLNNRQALVMAEAAALSQLDMQNLNNRQQAAVQNAQNFLSVDMANLSNQQQTDLFKAQQRVQSLFTDQAAQNATQQFNASSQNQVDQFFASLATQTAQFNATQANAQSQFNAGQVNTIERFNAEINNQRDQFNAQNRLIIDQSNAQWRREIATADTAAVNRANELNATALLGLSQSSYNNLWQYYRDNMEWAWTSAENERQRITNIAIAQLQADASKSIQEMKQDYQSSANMGQAVFKVLTSDLSNSILGNLFG
jgi:hypothetical protein